MVNASAIWSFTDQTVNPTSVDPGITASPVINTATSTTIYTTGGYSSSPVLQVAFGNTANQKPGNDNYYISFNVSGSQFKALTLTLKAARGGSATPRGFRIRTSLDGFAADLPPGTNDIPTVRSTWTNYSFTLPDVARVDSLEVRLHAYVPSLAQTIEIDDINITVDTQTASPKIFAGTGTITPSGTLTASIPVRKRTFAAVIANAGTLLTSIPVRLRSYAGSLPSAGELFASVPVRLRNYAGSLPSAGTLSTFVAGRARSYAGTVSSAGTLLASIPQRLRNYAGSLPSAGELFTSVPVRLRSFSGSVSPAATLKKLVSSRFVGDLSTSGTFSFIRDAQKLATGGTVGLSAALSRSVGKVRRGTVALVSTVRTGSLKRVGGTVAPTGSLMRRADVAQRRAAKSAALLSSSWNAYLRPLTFKAEFIEFSVWRVRMEIEFMIAGSVEELRLQVDYVYKDVYPMPDAVFVQVGPGSALQEGTVTQISDSRVMVSLMVGPLPRGTYPVRVSFNAGEQTPILFAGNLSVFD